MAYDDYKVMVLDDLRDNIGLQQPVGRLFLNVFL